MENPRNFCGQSINFADTVYGIIEWRIQDGSLRKQRTVAIMVRMKVCFRGKGMINES